MSEHTMNECNKGSTIEKSPTTPFQPIFKLSLHPLPLHKGGDQLCKLALSIILYVALYIHKLDYKIFLIKGN